MVARTDGNWDLTVAKVAVVAAGKGRVSPWNSNLLERCLSPVQGGHSAGRRYNDETVIIGGSLNILVSH